MEHNALHRNHVDWDGTRRAAFAEAGNARRPADTYPAIRTALDELGDGHKALFDPQGAEEMSGDEQVRQPVEGRALPGRVGYLSPPAVRQPFHRQFRGGRDRGLPRPARYPLLRRGHHRPPTGNVRHRLSDGAILNLTEVKDADRTGRTYDSPIPPDQPVADNPGRRGGEDPVASAAVTWLSRQPGCAMK
ncbi:hypothetical protein [Streptomyces sp. NPDC052693]|uniref:hypothetical protein n=1 Tax=Streptomyces sp. NPDC052693 TaxID=3155814 RepID=UPI003449E282